EEMPQTLDRRRLGRVTREQLTAHQQAEAFLFQRRDDLVLGLEIAIQRRRAVVDCRRYLANRHVGITAFDEQPSRRIEDDAAQREALGFSLYRCFHERGSRRRVANALARVCGLIMTESGGGRLDAGLDSMRSARRRSTIDPLL